MLGRRLSPRATGQERACGLFRRAQAIRRKGRCPGHHGRHLANRSIAGGLSLSPFSVCVRNLVTGLTGQERAGGPLTPVIEYLTRHPGEQGPRRKNGACVGLCSSCCLVRVYCIHTRQKAPFLILIKYGGKLQVGRTIHGYDWPLCIIHIVCDTPH